MDGYSKLVAWLKVLLPLMSLLLLSTLFFLSRNADPVTSLPFADTDIDERLREQQITAPVFAGTTTDGDMFRVTIGRLSSRTDLRKDAEALAAMIDLATGARILLSADEGQFDIATNISRMTGRVELSTSTGYALTTDALEANFDTFTLQSPGPVTGTSPMGTFDAGMVRLHRKTGETNAHLIFTNGVKLIYDPEKAESE